MRWATLILAVVFLGCSSQTTCISHVVIIIQENRSVDNLFQFLPGANGR